MNTKIIKWILKLRLKDIKTMECGVDTVDYSISGTSFYLDILMNPLLKRWLFLHVMM
jgi:hypothetical protein